MNPTTEQLRAIREISLAIIDAVKVAGSHGAPGGVIYAALMAHGASLQQYQSFMDALVRLGKIRQQGDLYFSV